MQFLGGHGLGGAISTGQAAAQLQREWSYLPVTAADIDKAADIIRVTHQDGSQTFHRKDGFEDGVWTFIQTDPREDGV